MSSPFKMSYHRRQSTPDPDVVNPPEMMEEVFTFIPTPVFRPESFSRRRRPRSHVSESKSNLAETLIKDATESMTTPESQPGLSTSPVDKRFKKKRTKRSRRGESSEAEASDISNTTGIEGHLMKE